MRELRSTDECGETLEALELVHNLFPITGKLVLPEVVTQTYVRRLGRIGPVEKVVIFTVNHRGSLTSRELKR